MNPTQTLFGSTRTGLLPKYSSASELTHCVKSPVVIAVINDVPNVTQGVSSPGIRPRSADVENTSMFLPAPNPTTPKRDYFVLGESLHD